MESLSREEILGELRTALADQLGIDEAEVAEDKLFMDDKDQPDAPSLGADSLDMVEVIMGFEDGFSIKIADDEARSLKTVGQAVDFIYERQSAGTDADKGSAAA